MGLVFEFLIGFLAAGICVWGVKLVFRKPGIGFWSMGLPIAALVYVVFAATYKHAHGLMHESLGLLIYSSFIFLSRKFGLWLLAAGWLLHIIWDVFHGQFFMNTFYVPAWYPGACAGFDLFIAGYIGYFFLKKSPQNENIDGNYQNI